MNKDEIPTQGELDDTMCYGVPISAASQMAMELRLMMERTEGKDKCTLCKAAEELEKSSLSKASDLGSSCWPLLAMLMLGFGGYQAFDVDALKAYMDVIKEKAQSLDSKLQNES